MELAKYIDHTILKPEATLQDVKKICDEAKKYKFASVCVNPYYAEFVSDQLKGTGVKTCVVVGLPLGANTKEVKASGGIRDYKTTMKMIDAGANRIGASAGIAIISEANQQH